MAKKVLGKGLSAIIATSPAPVDTLERGISDDTGRILELDIAAVIPNPEQPRTHFDEASLGELADSIRSVGLIQPIIVRKTGDRYMIVAGERRYRAVKLAGNRTVRAIVIEADEERQFTLALIENIQRDNLDPMEEARAYRMLISRFNLRQADVARQVGKERATIANALRLLNLPPEIQQGISENRISTGHAKVLLSVNNPGRQKDLYEDTVKRGLSVRALEQLVAEGSGQPAAGDRAAKPKHAQIRKMEEKLVSALGTKVEIRHTGSRGRIEISYYSLDDFERIIDILTGS